MQFGVFSVSDIARDPVTKKTATEAERIDAVQRIACTAEEVGMDVFAIGEHLSPPFFSSSPALILAAIAAQTKKIILSTSTLVTANDPVNVAQDFSLLQHLAKGRVDLMLARADAPGPCQDSSSLAHDMAIENTHLLRELWTEEFIEWEGRFREPLVEFTSTPRPLDNVPPLIWHAATNWSEVADDAAFYGDPFFAATSFAPANQLSAFVELYRQRFEEYGRGPGNQAILGLGSPIFVARNSQDAFAGYRPYFNEMAYGMGITLEQYAESTMAPIGSVQQVIERVLALRETYGDYQRHIFLVDHTGMPLTTVLDQLDIIGNDVVPVLRQDFETLRVPGVPSDPPSHAERVRARADLPGICGR